MHLAQLELARSLLLAQLALYCSAACIYTDSVDAKFIRRAMRHLGVSQLKLLSECKPACGGLKHWLVAR